MAAASALGRQGPRETPHEKMGLRTSVFDFFFGGEGGGSRYKHPPQIPGSPVKLSKIITTPLSP